MGRISVYVVVMLLHVLILNEKQPKGTLSSLKYHILQE